MQAVPSMALELRGSMALGSPYPFGQQVGQSSHTGKGQALAGASVWGTREMLCLAQLLEGRV